MDQRLNIGLKLSHRDNELVLLFSQYLNKEYSTDYCIDNIKYFCHLTLYSPLFAIERKEELCKIIQKYQNIKITLKVEDLVFRKGKVQIKFLLSDELKNLQYEIIMNTNRYRNGLLSEKYKNELNADLQEEKKTYIKIFGQPNILEFYDAHLTITKFSKHYGKTINRFIKNIDDIKSKLPDELFFNKIQVFEMDNDSRCIKELIY